MHDERILGVFWPNTITNVELLRKTDATSLATQIKRGRWRWLGHVCRMSPGAPPYAGQRMRRGRPKETWRRIVEKEMKECGLTWDTITKLRTDISGDLLLKPYAPPGTVRMRRGGTSPLHRSTHFTQHNMFTNTTNDHNWYNNST